jgi:sulfatase modifying factor 1
MERVGGWPGEPADQLRDWYEAYAFCIMDGGFLPSEAEWEYAAAGGSQQREYPWGSTDPGTDNQYAIFGCYYPSGVGDGSAPTCSTSAVNIAPVGLATLGAGLWGQLDLAGNVKEWSMDWYAPYVNPCSDCAYLTAASDGPDHGGDYALTASYLLPPNRTGNGIGPKADRFTGFGLRCARTP